MRAEQVSNSQGFAILICFLKFIAACPITLNDAAKKARDNGGAVHPSILAFVFVYKPKRNEHRCRSLVSLRPAASLARFHSIKRSSSFASFPEVQCNTCTAAPALASIQAASPSSLRVQLRQHRRANKSNFAKKHLARSPPFLWTSIASICHLPPSLSRYVTGAAASIPIQVRLSFLLRSRTRPRLGPSDTRAGGCSQPRLCLPALRAPPAAKY